MPEQPVGDKKINSLKKYPVIPKQKLIIGRWYLGRGRNSNLGRWTGNWFATIGKGFNDWVLKAEDYYTEEGGCFQPFVLIEEGEIVPFGVRGWEAHYGTELIISKIEKKEQPTE
jgi:hypothetical protein